MGWRGDNLVNTTWRGRPVVARYYGTAQPYLGEMLPVGEKNGVYGMWGRNVLPSEAPVPPTCTCTPLFTGAGAPRNFTEGVDYPNPRKGARYYDSRSNRYYTYYDGAWIPESYVVNPDPLDYEVGDIVTVDEGTAPDVCLQLYQWDGMALCEYGYNQNC